ncbi:MAG: deoxyribose-phosphate aldolase, partial [Pseudonocardiales bacterium]|nr:deoxyribose-phosphate aldolase [Pseudonocardiales bacterium]
MTTTPLTPATVTVEQVAKMIDHALLRPELTVRDIGRGCELAARYQVISVCVRPSDVPLAVELLAGTGVLVGTVIGFPHGSVA